MQLAMVRVLVALAALFFAGPLLAQDKPIDPPKDEAELQRRLQTILLDHNIPGMGVVITDRSGLRWVAGIGKANVETGADATPDTLFRVGSISKMWVALAALKLESEGKLDLNASVRALVPEMKFENPWEATDPVRVVHLMEHTTGWDDISFREWVYNDPKPATLKECLDFDPRSRASRWRPGTRYSYNNSGPAVAAYVIEKITGKRFEDYVAEAFFKLLGMDTASFLLTPETDQRLTRLHHEDGKTEYPYLHFLMRPSGSLNASAREMSKLLMFLLNRGSLGEVQILPAAALDRMETPVSYLGAQAGLKTGYGLNNGTVMEEDGFVWHGHTGGLGGTRSELSYLPDAGVGFFYSMNGHDDDAFKETSKLLRATLARDLKKPELPPVVKAEAETSLYAGWYEFVSPRHEVERSFTRIVGMARVQASDGGLVVQSLIGRNAGDYVAVSPTLYRRPNDPAASLALLPPGPDGQIIQTTRATLKAIPSWMAWTQIGVTALTLVLMVTAPLFALVWIPRRLFGRMKSVKHFSARVWPLLAGLALAGAVAIYILTNEEDLGNRTALAMGFTACTMLFALFSFVALFKICRVPRREVNLGTYLHTLLTSAVLSVVTVYLLYWGIIGLRTWV